MNMKFYKYQGAGNDFLIADNRDGSVQLTTAQIAALCDRRYGVGADGLMLLESCKEYDFRMVYYNSDGSGGMMCGNGGRCIVAFAADMGLTHFDFDAADGFHTAQILEVAGKTKIVRLKMKDVVQMEVYETLTGVTVPSRGCFLDTGTRHYVRMVADLESYDVVSEGGNIRYNAQELLPIGVNVNYIEPSDDVVKVRTYEKGVEDETFACGTGIVASCVAAYKADCAPSEIMPDGRVKYNVKAKRDALSVDFIPSADVIAEDVWLTGPATFVAQIIVDID